MNKPTRRPKGTLALFAETYRRPWGEANHPFALPYGDEVDLTAKKHLDLIRSATPRGEWLELHFAEGTDPLLLSDYLRAVRDYAGVFMCAQRIAGSLQEVKENELISEHEAHFHDAGKTLSIKLPSRDVAHALAGAFSSYAALSYFQQQAARGRF